MVRNIISVVVVLLAAFSILLVSVFKSASVSYDFQGGIPNREDVVNSGFEEQIDYYLPYAGKVLPGSPLWPVKVLRDRLWLMVTTDPLRKTELHLLFADKRLASSRELFKKGDYENGFMTFEKALQYLSQAYELEKINRASGADTTELVKRIAHSALKHYEVKEEILTMAPEDARPKIIFVADLTKYVYNDTKNILIQKGVEPPKNPFSWE